MLILCHITLIYADILYPKQNLWNSLFFNFIYLLIFHVQTAVLSFSFIAKVCSSVSSVILYIQVLLYPGLIVTCNILWIILLNNCVEWVLYWWGRDVYCQGSLVQLLHWRSRHMLLLYPCPKSTCNAVTT